MKQVTVIMNKLLRNTFLSAAMMDSLKRGLCHSEALWKFADSDPVGRAGSYPILLLWWEDWVEGAQLHPRGLGEPRLRDTMPET